jgi:phosphoadenosine phosphosulfate reductase
MNGLQQRVAEIEEIFKTNTIADALKWLSETFAKEVSYSSSFGPEGQIIAHQIFTNHIPIEVFTIDTGRQFQETYSVWRATNEKYGVNIKAYYPHHENLGKMISEKGPNSFYDSVENRKECCFIRKIEPLNRALKGQKIWLSGLRAEQSEDRAERKQVEWDEKRGMIKVYPLFYWTSEEVKMLIKNENIPYNELWDKGYLSVGCAPCTRAVRTGEHERSGRWWWENSNNKECGIHTDETIPQPSNWII